MEIKVKVSIHAPARGATSSFNQWSKYAKSFNPRTRTGCDRPVLIKRPLMVVFQSTHPHGVRPLPERWAWTLTRCFNPRTRTGCDLGGRFLFGNKGVSIHAPARGATNQSKYSLIRVKVSIHAPARGATPWGITFPLGKAVSIHAPARGATLSQMCSFNRNAFQSTHPHGVRQYTGKISPALAVFQSTHPHGVRLNNIQALNAIRSFNPRTRTGCDANCYFWTKHSNSFNPRTRTGCDTKGLHKLASQTVSIHAPARGATESSSLHGWSTCVSIHAPARGATVYSAMS